MTQRGRISLVDNLALWMAAIGTGVVFVTSSPGYLVVSVTFSAVVFAAVAGVMRALLEAPDARASTDLTALLGAMGTWAVALTLTHATLPFPIIGGLAILAFAVSARFMFGAGSPAVGHGSGAERFTRRQWLVWFAGAGGGSVLLAGVVTALLAPPGFGTPDGRAEALIAAGSVLVISLPTIVRGTPLRGVSRMRIVTLVAGVAMLMFGLVEGLGENPELALACAAIVAACVARLGRSGLAPASDAAINRPLTVAEAARLVFPFGLVAGLSFLLVIADWVIRRPG